MLTRLVVPPFSCAPLSDIPPAQNLMHRDHNDSDGRNIISLLGVRPGSTRSSTDNICAWLARPKISTAEHTLPPEQKHEAEHKTYLAKVGGGGLERSEKNVAQGVT